VNERIEEYKRSLKFREKLIFIELINDSEKHSAYQLIENKSMIEFLQLRKEIEIKEWLESCLKDLEDKNYFKNVYKSLSSKLEENIKN
jgi:DNA mismatch repair ATPase MutS